MGNMSSTKIDESVFPYNRSDFNELNFIKNRFGDLKVLQNKRNKDFYLEKSLSFDSDDSLNTLKKTFDDLQKAKDVNYIRIYAIKMNHKSLSCSPSNILMVTDYFELTLEDMMIKHKNISQLCKEHVIWGLLFDIAKVIQFNQFHLIENHFIHPRAIYMNKNNNSWHLIHHSFFNTNNFTDAVSGHKNYCSPELFNQIMSKTGNFFLLEGDKSSLFSLGLIIIHLIYLNDNQFSLSQVYDRRNVRVDVYYLHKQVEGLKAKGYSNLLIRVLNDMIQEFEYLRISAKKLNAYLGGQIYRLKNKDFTGHDAVLKDYIEMKSRQDDQSINDKISQIYKGSQVDNDFNPYEGSMNENTIGYLKQKAVPFDDRFMIRSSIKN